MTKGFRRQSFVKQVFLLVALFSLFGVSCNRQPTLAKVRPWGGDKLCWCDHYGPCCKDMVVKWKYLPLGINFSSNVSWQDKELVKSEALRWNKALGFTAFVFGHGMYQVTIRTTPNHPSAASTGIKADEYGTPSSALVRIKSYKFGVIAHELGHVLGLEHDDDDPFSVMYPKPLDRSSIRGNDVDALRKLYVKKK